MDTANNKVQGHPTSVSATESGQNRNFTCVFIKQTNRCANFQLQSSLRHEELKEKRKNHSDYCRFVSIV